MNHKDEEGKGYVHDGLVEEIERALLDASPDEVRSLVNEMGMNETFEADIAQLRRGLEGVKALGRGAVGESHETYALTDTRDPLAPGAKVRLAFALGSNTALQQELQLTPEGVAWMSDGDVLDLYQRLSARKHLL